MKKLFFSVIVIAALVFFGHGLGAFPASVATAEGAGIENAFKNHASNVQVEGQGKVVKILPDDNNGSRHQLFIVRLSSGQTLLIAHNIDLAPRVFSLRKGKVVSFAGEYEWNPKGGVIHWTHRDPEGRHPAGWIKYNGQIFQ